MNDQTASWIQARAAEYGARLDSEIGRPITWLPDPSYNSIDYVGDSPKAFRIQFGVEPPSDLIARVFAAHGQPLRPEMWSLGCQEGA